MKKLMVAAGLGKRNTVRFVFGGVQACLGLQDLKYLEGDEGRLSVNVMEWFTVWFSHFTVSIDIVVCLPKLFLNQRAFMQEKDSFALPVLKEFFSMRSGLGGAVGHTLLEPILHCDPWSVSILSDTGFYKYDSIRDGWFHGTERLHVCLEKMWAMFRGFSVYQKQWRRAASL